MKKYNKLSDQHFKGASIAHLLAYHDNKSLYMVVHPEEKFVWYEVYELASGSSEQTPNGDPICHEMQLRDAIIKYNKLP